MGGREEREEMEGGQNREGEGGKVSGETRDEKRRKEK